MHSTHKMPKTQGELYNIGSDQKGNRLLAVFKIDLSRGRYQFLDKPTSSSRVSIYQQFKIFREYGSIIQIHRHNEAQCDVYYRSLYTHPFINDMECACEWFEYRPMPYEKGPNSIPKSTWPLVHSKELQAAPHQNSPANILHKLNDDCLFLIFRSMHLLDLMAVVNVCTRFRQIAVNVFQTRYPRGKFDLRDLRHNGDVMLTQMDDCLTAFGEYIKSIAVTFELHEELLLGMIAEHCTNLEELEFNGSNVSMETILALRPLMDKLKAVTLRCMNTEVALLFSAKSRLESLYVHCRDGTAVLPPNLRVANLEIIHLFGVRIQAEAFEAFFKRHPGLRILHISERVLDKSLLHSIPRYLQQVESVVLNGDFPADTSFSKWEELQNLRTLVLNGRNFPIGGILQSLVDGDVPLEQFRLLNASVDHPSIITALCQLRTLKDLEFTENANEANVTDADLIRMSRSFPDLEHVRVTSPMISLKGIRAMMKHADDLKWAYFRVDFKQCVNYHTDARDCDFIAKSMSAKNGARISVTISGLSGERIHDKKYHAIRLNHSSWLTLS